MIVALVIGLILTFTAVMPLVSDYSDAKTFTNTGIIRMSEIDDSVSKTISWDHTKPSVITIDSNEKPMPQNLTIALTIGATDDFIIRYADTSVTVFHNSTVVNASVSDGTDMTITIASGTVTSSNGSYTDTFTYTDSLFIVDESGSYIMKNMNDSAYVLKDSDIHAFGRTYLSGGINTQCNFNINGSIKDGFTIEPWGTTATLTVGEYTITDSEISGYTDLYSFTKIQFGITDSSSHSDTVTYGQVIVPYEVTAESSNPAVYKNLVSVLPLFALILFVAGAASLVYFKNKD